MEIQSLNPLTDMQTKESGLGAAAGDDTKSATEQATATRNAILKQRENNDASASLNQNQTQKDPNGSFQEELVEAFMNNPDAMEIPMRAEMINELITKVEYRNEQIQAGRTDLNKEIEKDKENLFGLISGAALDELNLEANV